MSFPKPQVIFHDTTCLYYFSSNITYFYISLQKYLIKVQIFKFSTAQVKIHQISHVIFQTKSEFSSKFGKHFSITRENSFLAETLYAVDKSSTSKYKFSDLPLLASKFTKFAMSFLKPRTSFSSNSPSPSSVMRDTTSVLFRLKLYMFSTKGTNQVQIFRLSTARINQIPCNFSSHKSVFT